MAFSLGEFGVPILIGVIALIFFFGRNKVKEWVTMFKENKKEAETMIKE